MPEGLASKIGHAHAWAYGHAHSSKSSTIICTCATLTAFILCKTSLATLQVNSCGTALNVYLTPAFSGVQYSNREPQQDNTAEHRGKQCGCKSIYCNSGIFTWHSWCHGFWAISWLYIILACTSLLQARFSVDLLMTSHRGSQALFAACGESAASWQSCVAAKYACLAKPLLHIGTDVHSHCKQFTWP